MHKKTLLALAACFAASAAAQTAVRPDASDPKAAAPARPYESAFKDYKRYTDVEVSRWREVNDEVGRLNGHIGHVPQQPGAVARPGTQPPAPAGHGGHK
jgi:hypothetical protein